MFASSLIYWVGILMEILMLESKLTFAIFPLHFQQDLMVTK